MNNLMVESIALLVVGVGYGVIHYYLNAKKNKVINLFKEGNVCIVVAHPDDEVMFFLPTLKLLFNNKDKTEIFILSLSNGNYYGIGKIREKEFTKVWSYLGGHPDNYKIMDDPNLQDGWNPWNEQYISKVLSKFCSKRNIKKVLTFDDYGVSGHPNHISVYKGAQILAKSKSIQLFSLCSTNLIQKYLGILSFPFIFHKSLLSVSFSPISLLRLMFLYRSQFVFYRVLFCLFSQYAYYNTYVLHEDT
ncbi:N-acetylglucosaminylphosphatidylinositol deacetylase, putative [Plasmodium vinckei lentum]|uniref:N-acetylglucosaminylphosphatidylinositol deacetylase n=1 Tax=Plasmodium vinckei lentum TaxID=138297 RepID=A0A6V7SA98_PLAVN|nr:N-acetylglucosaminylphosphatidylinositol deacetylase, putative [Plasmodium vinckei lentum]